MKIYKEELSIANLIKENTSIAFTLELNPPKFQPFDFTKAKLNRTISKDLFPVYSLLVSSVWNINDDVFTSERIWEARNTPKHHPTNINHDQLDIVGHITDIWVVDAELNLIPDDTNPQDLPELIHIINESVVYTHFQDAEKMDRVLTLIDDIETGKKYVSMEALFADFDYAVVDPYGDNHVIERNEGTAFLTKHLRAYGGTGMYEGHKVGRVLKSFVFVGKGFVDAPANPASVIFLQGLPFATASHKNSLEINNGVLSNNENLEKQMSIELENKVAALMAENEKLKADMVASTAGALEAKVAELNTANEALKASIADLTQKLTQKDEAVKASEMVSEAFKAERTSLESRLVEAEKASKDANDALATIKVEQVAFLRTAKLIAANLSEADAKALVTKYANLNDEQWEDVSALHVNKQKQGSGTQTETTLSYNFNASDTDTDKAKATLEALQKSVASIFAKDKTNA